MRRLCEEKGKSRRLEKKIFKDFYLNSSCGYKILSQNFETSVLQMLKKKKKKNSNHITIMPLFLWQSTSLWVIYYIGTTADLSRDMSSCWSWMVLDGSFSLVIPASKVPTADGIVAQSMQVCLPVTQHLPGSADPEVPTMAHPQ